MRAVLLAILFAALPAHAQTTHGIPAKDIPSVLPGVWAMSARVEPGNEPSDPCKDGRPIRIWFESKADGLVYRSAFLPPVKPGYEGVQSRVRFIPMVWGLGLGGIRLKYDGEKRLDDNGVPVEWILVMPNKDEFYWRRVDWRPSVTTPVSVRCPDPDLSS